MSDWISVNDRLPEKGKWYLICSDCNRPHEKVVTMAFLDSVINGNDLIDPLWLTHNDYYRNITGQNDEWEKVTHWMPLPEPPENAK